MYSATAEFYIRQTSLKHIKARETIISALIFLHAVAQILSSFDMQTVGEKS